MSEIVLAHLVRSLNPPGYTSGFWTRAADSTRELNTIWSLFSRDSRRATGALAWPVWGDRPGYVSSRLQES
jgi:hypothetical protein